MSRRGVVRAGAFGSVARGQATKSSDVDFLVEYEEGRTLFDLAGARLDLSEALGREVDVATAGSLHPGLRERILREAVSICWIGTPPWPGGCFVLVERVAAGDASWWRAALLPQLIVMDLIY